MRIFVFILFLSSTNLYSQVGKIGTSSSATKDRATNATTTVDYEHHEIHSGSHYYICGYDLDFDNGDTIDFQLTTSNTRKWIHITFNVATSATTTLTVYESATVASDGNTLTAYNNNRNSSNTTSLTLLQTDGTVSVAGDTIYKESYGSGTGPASKGSGFAERDKELILKQNTTYRFVFESHVDNVVFNYCAEWYEHTNKN